MSEATKPASVDAGWRSRKLIIGVAFGLLLIVGSSVLLVWAGHFTPPPPVGQERWFTPTYWAIGCGCGLFFVAICIGLISADKVLDFCRELIPVIKARFGIASKPKAPRQ